MTTISKSDNRKVTFSGMEEGHAIIVERQAYIMPGGARKKWDKTVTALTIPELRKILELAEKRE